MIRSCILSRLPRARSGILSIPFSFFSTRQLHSRSSSNITAHAIGCPCPAHNHEADNAARTARALVPHPSLQVSKTQIQQFRKEGFLILKDVVPASSVSALNARIAPMFSGKFETGIYPDEWHWRTGISLPHATREICNGWKCDKLVASIVLSQQLGKLAATLMNWGGTRIAQDSLWYKPCASLDPLTNKPLPGSPVSYHQDAPYISHQFVPKEHNSITVWVALDDVSPQTGTIEYVKGSHRWKPVVQSTSLSSAETQSSSAVGVPQIHTPSPDAYRSAMLSAAAANGVEKPEIVSVEVPAGSLAIHHQDLWHGSGPNKSSEKLRRSIGIHLLRSDVQFVEEPTYIYGRYKLHDSQQLNETFFPIVYESSGYMTPWMRDYCKDMLAHTPQL